MTDNSRSYLNQFIQPDTIVPDPTQPEDWNVYTYTRDNPVNYTDPTGHDPFNFGYLEGVSSAAGWIQGSIAGEEIVYDYATMTRARFSYTGQVGGVITSAGTAGYIGTATGFHYQPKLPTSTCGEVKPSQLIVKDYGGPFEGFYAGAGPSTPPAPVGVGATVGIGLFHSTNGGSVQGGFAYASGSIGFPAMPGEFVSFHTNYTVELNKLPSADQYGVEYYYDDSGHVNRAKLINDIMSADNSPLPSTIKADPPMLSIRSTQVGIAMVAASLFEQYYQSK